MTRTIPGSAAPAHTLRIASVPASHVYVRHLSALDGGDAVVRLTDPPPADGRTVPGGWWPPVMLDPTWIRRNHHRFDVFHVHFGFDTVSPRTLGDIIGELRSHDKPWSTRCTTCAIRTSRIRRDTASSWTSSSMAPTN